MIIKRSTYDQLLTTISSLEQKNKELTQVVDLYRKVNQKLEKDIRSLAMTSLYYRPDVIFPNTDERGLGDSDTPLNLSDIFEM